MFSSTFSKLSFLLFLTSLSLLDMNFSIVGYEPEDLTSIDKLIDLFESWLSKHGKAYKSIEEKLERFEVLFKENLKHIDETNKKVTSYWLGLNEFADISHEEFKDKYLGLKGDHYQMPERTRDSSSSTNEDSSDAEFMDLPKSVDWRKKGAVTNVKNQGACGSCVEGINQIVTGNLTALSEVQELIDCDKPSNNGCNGGLMDYAFQYIMSTTGGLHKEDDYPYLMEEGTCEEKKVTLNTKLASVLKIE
ncbi:hypothetical protein MKW94_009792 [Papaver nudicaule]|uniref:Uncharacterized protein n=1 Tax=Papaver nudicaule TaxID=74823 RepID=A0AA42AZG4_PAPNU|nr:hypothetical protein [Papaver nudicaule]